MNEALNNDCEYKCNLSNNTTTEKHGAAILSTAPVSSEFRKANLASCASMFREYCATALKQ